jgi:hypothetical protein
MKSLKFFSLFTASSVLNRQFASVGDYQMTANKVLLMYFASIRARQEKARKYSIPYPHMRRIK